MTTRRAELEAAIDEDPYDQRAYAVLADHLQELGDPRGELIALQLGGRSASMEHAAGEALARMGAEGVPPAGVQFGWALGYARSAIVEPGTAKGTRDVLAHPSCRFLAELRIRHNNAPLAGSIKAIAAARPACLRLLQLGQETHYGPDGKQREVGDLSELWAAVPRLEHLEIHGSQLEAGTIELPHLQSFTLDTAALTTEVARAIAQARWPALQHLTVRCGAMQGGARRWLEALVARDDLPALHRLVLHETRGTDQLLAALVPSPLLQRLESIDLTHNDVTDAGAQTILRHRDAFSHLMILELGYNELTPEASAKLAELPMVQPGFTKGVGGGEDDDAYDDEHYDDVDE